MAGLTPDGPCGADGPLARIGEPEGEASEERGLMVSTRPSTSSGSAHRPRRTPKRPASSLAERWTTIDGIDVFYRESPEPPDAPAMVHVHGFGLSGRYLLPTAERLGG